MNPGNLTHPNDYQQILAIIGSRTPSKETHNRVGKLMNHLFSKLNDKTLVISGGAVTGSDYWAKYLSNLRKIPYVEAVAFWHPPNRDGYDPGAGHFRNRVIAKLCTGMVAFWDGKSPGTGGTIKYAKMIGKPVEIVDISIVHPLDKLVLPMKPPANTTGPVRPQTPA